MKEKPKTTSTTATKNKDRKEQVDGSYSEKVRAKWFCCAFNLVFLQLTCKACLIFKSNLEFIGSWELGLYMKNSF